MHNSLFAVKVTNQEENKLGVRTIATNFIPPNDSLMQDPYDVSCATCKIITYHNRQNTLGKTLFCFHWVLQT